MEATRETGQHKPDENSEDELFADLDQDERGHSQSLRVLNNPQLTSTSPTSHKVQFASLKDEEDDIDGGPEEQKASHKLLTQRHKSQVSSIRKMFWLVIIKFNQRIIVVFQL